MRALITLQGLRLKLQELRLQFASSSRQRQLIFLTYIKGFCMKAGNFFWLGVSSFFFFAAYCSPEVIKHQNSIGTAKSTLVKCLFLINTSSLTERKREESNQE